MQLVGFCDASLKAYAAMVYLVNENSNCILLASKTRVAPLKTQTIPRLELLVALLLNRLMVSVEQSLSNFAVSCICYTDPLIVLHWIRGTDKHWKPFVQNRVREIRGKIESSHWHHCQGEANNPADMPSRGLTLKELKDSQIWFYGPSWLKEKSLVSMQIQDDLPPECLEELRVKEKEALVLSVIESKGSIEAIMDIERFS